MKIEQPFSLNAGGTISSGNSLVVTTADKLTVGGVIVPQTKTLSFPLNALNIAVSSALFVADEAYQITSVKASWGVASVSMVFDIEKLTGTTVPGAGTSLLQSTIDTSGAANTVNTGSLTGTTADLQLAVGNRIGIKISGTITSLVGMVLTLTLKRI